MNKICKQEIKSAKSTFYKNQVADLLTKSPRQWYSSFKRLTSYDQHKTEPLHVEEISKYSDQEQAEMIADHKARIANQYEPLNKDDIISHLTCMKTSPSSLQVRSGSNFVS